MSKGYLTTHVLDTYNGKPGSGIKGSIFKIDGENKVKISNFGTFILRHKKPRLGRNPKTKKETIISERNVILFKPSKFLKNQINHGN